MFVVMDIAGARPVPNFEGVELVGYGILVARGQLFAHLWLCSKRGDIMNSPNPFYEQKKKIA